MKRFRFSIALKLTVYFTVALLIFAVAIGSVFALLFRNYSVEMHKKNMLRAAYSVADTMSELVTGTTYTWTQDRYGKYEYWEQDLFFIRSLNRLTDADIWIIDENLNILTNQRIDKPQITMQDLPKNAGLHIQAAFQGKVRFSEDFSDVLDTPTLTVGVPVRIPSGNTYKIIGAVLLHDSVAGINEAVENGSVTLFASIMMALMLGILLSVIFAYYFTRPLKKINLTAQQIAEGDYSVSTNVKQTDEIGELAGTIDALSVRLNAASRESEKLQQMRQDFVANISHELRTPVTVMRGFLEALCEKVVTDPEQVAEYHRELLNESLYMQRLVNDILDLSRLQNADFSMNMGEFNLYDCVGDAVRSARRIGSARGRGQSGSGAGEAVSADAVQGVAVEFEYDTTQYLFYGDYDRIRQMMLIVLDNAIKFTAGPDGAASLPPVRVTLKDGAVSISNTGIGISAEELPFIFERFYKSRSEQNKTGTGLGLAIAKQIAVRHGIGITVASIPSGDTTICFRFAVSE